MNPLILSRTGITFKETFERGLNSSDAIDWAVAFASHAAYKSVEKSFREFFKSGYRSRVVFDITQGLTDPLIIEEFLTMPGNSQCRVYFQKNSKHGFMHHKFYYFKNKKENTKKFIIGSNNFTERSFFANEESSVLIDESAGDDFFSSVDDFWAKLWGDENVISPIDSPEILEAYTEFHRLSKKVDFFGSKDKQKSQQEFLKVFEKIKISYESMEAKVAYLAGLIVASVRSLRADEINQGVISISIKHQTMNPNTEDQGYIASRIEGMLLGGVRINQKEAIENQVQEIYENLKTFLEKESIRNQIEKINESQTNIIYKIRLRFSKKSKIFNFLKINLFNILNLNDASKLEIPKFILESDNKFARREFIRGYFDVRGRISKSDRVGTAGALRVALQISTSADRFGSQIEKFVNDEFNLNSKFSSGANRNKDSLVRFTPNKESLHLADTGWKKILMHEFIEYNQRTYNTPKKKGATIESA